MAITLEGTDIPAGNPTTSHTLVTTAIALVNDVVIVDFTHNGTGNGTVTDNSGDGVVWTRKSGQTYGGTKSQHTYYKRITTEWPSSITITVGSLTNSSAGVMCRYRGVITTGDPFRSYTVENNASGDESHASITTQANDWVICAIANSPDLTVTPTSPLVTQNQKLSTGGTDCSINVAGFEDTDGGGSGTLAWAQTDAAGGSAAYALIPEPPPAAAPPVVPTMAPMVAP